MKIKKKKNIKVLIVIKLVDLSFIIKNNKKPHNSDE
jgi:hypothetical protein